MLIVTPILIVDTEKTNHSRGFSFLHSMRYRRLILLTNSGRSRASLLNYNLCSDLV